MKHQTLKRLSTAIRRSYPGAAASCIVALGLHSPPAGAVVTYTVTKLPTLGGTYAYASAINASGQVAGYAYLSGNSVYHAALWQSGTAKDLGTLGGTYSESLRHQCRGAGRRLFIHDRQQRSACGSLAIRRRQRPGNARGTFGYADAINASGQVVGYGYVSGDTVYRAALWQSGSVRDLGSLGGTFSEASGINDSGQVVGRAYYSGNAVGHAALWQAGTVRDLGTLGGNSSGATAISASGQVVGYSYINGNTAYHATLWQSASIRDLGTLGGALSQANGINAAGQVVGYSEKLSGDDSAFVTNARGDMVDVNTLIAAGSGLTVFNANAINDNGQIAANGLAGSQQLALLLTPTGSIAWQTGAAGGSFSDGTNWEQGFGPSKFLDATIAPVASQSIVASVDSSVKSLTLGSAAGGAGRPTLQLTNGANITALNGVNVKATGTLSGSGIITGNLSNAGTVNATNLTVTGGISNSGTVGGSGYLNANLNNTSTGLVKLGATDNLQITGNTTNAGRILLDGGSASFVGATTNAATGTIFLRNANLQFSGTTNNSGQIDAAYGSNQVSGAITDLAGGKIILSGASTTTFYDTLDVKSGAELRVSAGSTGVFFGKVFQRTGSIFSGSGTKLYEGGLAVGNSPGLGIDQGSVELGSGGSYDADIGGLAAGTQFDKYEVAGNLSFAGTLKLVWYHGFTGTAGESFDLFDWGSSDGTFDSYDSRWRSSPTACIGTPRSSTATASSRSPAWRRPCRSRGLGY